MGPENIRDSILGLYGSAHGRLGMRRITVIVPAYNERDNIVELHRRLRSLPLSADIDICLLVVDDGSTDDTAEVVRTIGTWDPGVKLVCLRINQGQQTAIALGLQHASGEAVIVMDADMQTPPEYLPEMIGRWQSGAPIVAMRRSLSTQPLVKRVCSRAFYRFLSILIAHAVLIDVPDFYLLDREAVQRLITHNWARHFHRGALGYLGLPVIRLDYCEAPRFAGHPKYTWWKSLRLALAGVRAIRSHRRALAGTTGASK